MQATVIGVDFSTTPTQTELARATVFDASEAVVHEVRTASRGRSRIEVVAAWVRKACAGMLALIALDAPLGWPDAMRSDPFTSHSAGRPLQVCADPLFSRETDRQIRIRFDKRPLEVGANLIARTAHGALQFLREMNTEINGRAEPPLPLACSPRDLQHGSRVIEVYPAATLKSYGISTGSYKKRGEAGRSAHEAMIKALRTQGSTFESDVKDIAGNDNKVDVAVCVLAGWDFLAGRAMAPDNTTRKLAEREGWIWARQVAIAENGT